MIFDGKFGKVKNMAYICAIIIQYNVKNRIPYSHQSAPH